MSATLWAELTLLALSVSGTPSLSYMNCPDLVQCVPSPLANILCTHNVVAKSCCCVATMIYVLFCLTKLR